MKVTDSSLVFLYIKVVLVVFIVFATFFDVGKHLAFLDNKISKLLLLALVVIVLVIDLHTGIILLITFLMLMIQFNNIVVSDIRNKREMFLNMRPAPVDVKDQTPTTVKCDNIKKNEISCNIVNHTMDQQSNVDYNVDKKVKPYEVFVKMMTTQEHLEKASNSAFI